MSSQSEVPQDTCVGRVVEISGTNVVIDLFDTCGSLTYILNGTIYRGVSVGQFIGIYRDPYILVAKVEREYLKDISGNDSEIYAEGKIVRQISVKLKGFFIGNKYTEGLVAYPQIYNQVTLLSERQISTILLPPIRDEQKETGIPVGYTIDERIDIKIDPFSLFNCHLGIFGNTGSGKSNTLAKLYTELFSRHQDRTIALNLSNSHFMVIDFNGEYIDSDVFIRDKDVICVGDSEFEHHQIQISQNTFWDIETLSIIFSATEKTQKPFLKNAIKQFTDANNDTLFISDQRIIQGVGTAFFNTFNSNNCKDTNDLLHRIYDLIFPSEGEVDPSSLSIPWYNVLWHSMNSTYYTPNQIYISNKTKDEVIDERNDLESILNVQIDYISRLTPSQRIEVALLCELIYALSFNKTRLEFISPLIERVRSQSELIDQCIKLIPDHQSQYPMCSVVSLRNCPTSLKKIIPLLVARDSYRFLKKINRRNIQKTFHLIIDEAHNILSGQSNREDTSWKDYRLEVFEEIIKEGRKFGYTLTLASQRPYDISPTIISQLHNYLIHRLVNDKDLLMVDNAISTLDSVSKSRIPVLAPGQCILTGTSFSMPLTIQVEKLPKSQSPNSESADLENLWISR